jgi:uncharacterized membrane protein
LGRKRQPQKARMAEKIRGFSGRMAFIYGWLTSFLFVAARKMFSLPRLSFSI